MGLKVAVPPPGGIMTASIMRRHPIRPPFPHAPIPTILAGVSYRSRLEARHAIYFQQRGLAFLYEPHTYHFRTGGAYRPDFFLPGSLQSWYEVKPTRLLAERELRTENAPDRRCGRWPG